LNKLLQILINNNFSFNNNHGNSTWSLEYHKFEPGQEKLREALCTLGNGYLGTRGAFTEVSASRIHYPGTYMAGVFNKLDTNIAGKTITNEDMVNCPNWLPLTFKTDNNQDWINPSKQKIISYYQNLDFKEAALIRNYKIKEKSGKITSIKTRRIVHIVDMHLVAQEYSITPENYDGEIIIRTGLDGTVENDGVERYSDLNSLHLSPDETNKYSENGIYLSIITNQSKIKIVQASSLSISSNGEEIKPIAIDTKKEEKSIFQEYRIKVNKKQKYTFEKTYALQHQYQTGPIVLTRHFYWIHREIQSLGIFWQIL